MTGRPLPDVTVAILAHDRRDALAVTLHKVAALDYPADRLEVIVVDNASTDGTAEMVRDCFPHVRLIETGENLGIAGWNRAFATGRGDWFLVLDDDCYVEGDALRRALVAAGRFGADLVSTWVDSSEPGQSFSAMFPTGVLAFWGCCALVSRRALERVGGFDPAIFVWVHETEWMLRFLDAGLRHLYLPEVRAVHMKPLPAMTVPTQRGQLHNLAYTAARRLRAGDAAVALCGLLARAVIDGLRYGDGYWAGLPAVVAGARLGLSRRRPVRPPVSRLFRHNYVEFASPLQLRGRVRSLARRPGRLRPDYRAAYWAARSDIFPSEPAALRIP
jgi:Glycosyl transferase family 2